MAIYLAMVRVGQCEMCTAQFYLEAEEIPRACPSCNSRVWLNGIETRTGRKIRQGSSFEEKVLNKGVRSQKLKAWSDEHGAKRAAKKKSIKEAWKRDEATKRAKKSRKAAIRDQAGSGVGDQ